MGRRHASRTLPRAAFADQRDDAAAVPTYGVALPEPEFAIVLIDRRSVELAGRYPSRAEAFAAFCEVAGRRCAALLRLPAGEVPKVVTASGITPRDLAFDFALMREISRVCETPRGRSAG